MTMEEYKITRLARFVDQHYDWVLFDREGTLLTSKRSDYEELIDMINNVEECTLLIKNGKETLGSFYIVWNPAEDPVFDTSGVATIINEEIPYDPILMVG